MNSFESFSNKDRAQFRQYEEEIKTIVNQKFREIEVALKKISKSTKRKALNNLITSNFNTLEKAVEIMQVKKYKYQYEKQLKFMLTTFTTQDIVDYNTEYQGLNEFINDYIDAVWKQEEVEKQQKSKKENEKQMANNNGSNNQLLLPEGIGKYWEELGELIFNNPKLRAGYGKLYEQYNNELSRQNFDDTNYNHTNNINYTMRYEYIRAFLIRLRNYNIEKGKEYNYSPIDDINELVDELQRRLDYLLIKETIYKKFGVDYSTKNEKDKVSSWFNLNQAISKAKATIKDKQGYKNELKGQDRKGKKAIKTSYSEYGRKIQEIVNELNLDKNTGFKQVEDIIKDEDKTFKKASSLKYVGFSPKNILKLAKRPLAVIISALVVVGAITGVGIVAGNLNSENETLTAENDVNKATSSQETLETQIEDGAKYINAIETQADEKNVVYAGNEEFDKNYDVIKKISNLTEGIIKFNDDGSVSAECEYTYTLNDLESAKSTENYEAITSNMQELTNYAKTIGKSSNVKVIGEGSATIEASYCQQVNESWNNIIDYIDKVSQNATDIENNPVLDVSFTDEEVSFISSSLNLLDKQEVSNIPYCKYYRESGEVKMLVETKSMKGIGLSEISFTIQSNFKESDICPKILEAIKNESILKNISNFSVNIDSDIKNKNIITNINGEIIEGKINQILCNVKNKIAGNNNYYDANAIIIIEQDNGKLIYEIINYSKETDQKYTNEEIIANLENKIKQEITIEENQNEIQDIEME